MEKFKAWAIVFKNHKNISHYALDDALAIFTTKKAAKKALCFKDELIVVQVTIT